MTTTSKNADRPIGPEVRTGEAPRPSRTVLNGGCIVMKPLTTEHIDDLFNAVGGRERAWLWDYMPDGPFPDREVFEDFITRSANSEDPFFFTVIDKATEKAIGWASLLRIDVKNRVIETGHIMFSPLLQRTTAATECMYLFAKYVFDTLGYRRYEWKCNNLNAPSKRAAERFGFTFEGIFRQHMVSKGRNRDTAWYSILDSEWPEIKAGFEAWLDPGNFDEQGKQRKSLQSLRKTCSSP